MKHDWSFVVLVLIIAVALLIGLAIRTYEDIQTHASLFGDVDWSTCSIGERVGDIINIRCTTPED